MRSRTSTLSSASIPSRALSLLSVFLTTASMSMPFSASVSFAKSRAFISHTVISGDAAHSSIKSGKPSSARLSGIIMKSTSRPLPSISDTRFLPSAVKRPSPLRPLREASFFTSFTLLLSEDVIFISMYAISGIQGCRILRRRSGPIRLRWYRSAGRDRLQLPRVRRL